MTTPRKSSIHPTVCALLGLREGLRKLDFDVDENVYAYPREDGTVCLVLVDEKDKLKTIVFECGRYESGKSAFASEWTAAETRSTASQAAKYWAEFPDQQGVITALITKGFISETVKSVRRKVAEEVA